MSAKNYQATPQREIIAPRHESLRKEFDHLLPGYGEARLWVVARDPRWLFAYWEFDPTEHPGAREDDGTEHVFLRILRSDGTAETTIEILPSTGHWYVPVRLPDHEYTAELGYYAPGGVWAYVARSGSTRTPPLHPEKLTSGIRIAPMKQGEHGHAPEWGAEEDKLLSRLIAVEAAKASGIRRPPRRSVG